MNRHDAILFWSNPVLEIWSTVLYIQSQNLPDLYNLILLRGIVLYNGAKQLGGESSSVKNYLMQWFSKDPCGDSPIIT